MLQLWFYFDVAINRRMKTNQAQWILVSYLHKKYPFSRTVAGSFLSADISFYVLVSNAVPMFVTMK
jgi:hypothetical protein